MLALLALEFLLSGISGVRLGSVARKFVGRELQGCVDSFCPCGPDSVLVALGCVVMPKCLVRQRIHALPYLAAYCSVSALPESDSGYTLMRQSAAPPPNFTNFLRESGLDTFIPDSVLPPLCLFRLRSTRIFSILCVMALRKGFLIQRYAWCDGYTLI